jgi:hypothetical protein
LITIPFQVRVLGTLKHSSLCSIFSEITQSLTLRLVDHPQTAHYNRVIAPVSSQKGDLSLNPEREGIVGREAERVILPKTGQ